MGACNYSPCGSGEGGDTWTAEEIELFAQIDNPVKVQDYLDQMPMNHEVRVCPEVFQSSFGS